MRRLLVVFLCTMLPAPLFAGDNGPKAQTYQMLHRFSGGLGDGEDPLAGLIRVADGNLYGAEAHPDISYAEARTKLCACS